MQAKPSTGRGAGEYNNRVTIELNTPTDSASGQPVPAWGAFIHRWARILPRGGREQWRFEQLRAEVDYLVHLRNDSDTRTLKASVNRINWGGVILNVESIVDVDSRRVELELRCVSVTR
ncbi:MAG TPA: phage head closure protein [Planctomycetaceae bacterium]|jgi:SPP1 family predicted phage head-tail adaptor